MFARVASASLCLLAATGALAQEDAALDARLDALEAQVVAAEDLAAIKRLQRQYGYYVDKGLWEDVADLYTEDAISEEATGDVSRGIAGLEEKLKRWEQMQAGTRWTARNVWTGPKTICIEWDAEVNLRDGRTVKLREIGVHEIRDGKISIERFYYNPMQLQAPA